MMRIIRALPVAILLLLASATLHAQTYFGGKEYGITFGGSQYFGDLNDEYGVKFVRPAFGIFGRLHMNPYIALRASVNATRVGYKDEFSSNPYNRKRNLQFQSDVVEAVLQAEFNFFRFATGEDGSRFTPYLTGGVGVMYSNPFTNIGDRRYYLRPLGTEGQNAGYGDRRYSKIAMCFPVGVGIKYWIRPGLNFGVELADRLTTTDYLDDVSKTYVGANLFPTDPLNPNPAYVLQDRSIELSSEPLGRMGKQRGNATTKDQYFMLLFNLSFQLKVYRCPAYMNKGMSEF